jgi:UDP-N-acetyl-D-mannosaminuronic acid transferase (WecB/TagA/CpsF family)
MPVKYVWEWGNTADGNYIGRRTTDKIGFYGAAPVVRPTSLAAAVATTVCSTTTSNFGFTTSSQAMSIITLVNDIRARLVTLGLME